MQSKYPMTMPSIAGSIPLSVLQESQAWGDPPPETKAPDAVAGLGEAFLDLLVQANADGQAAEAMANQLASGQSGDIHGTMIALKEADIRETLTVNLKDKVIDAFYELWRMSL